MSLSVISFLILFPHFLPADLTSHSLVTMNSDAVFEKIRIRVGKILEGQDRTVQHVYKFVIKVGGEVKKTWSKFGHFG